MKLMKFIIMTIKKCVHLKDIRMDDRTMFQNKKRYENQQKSIYNFSSTNRMMFHKKLFMSVKKNQISI